MRIISLTCMLMLILTLFAVSCSDGDGETTNYYATADDDDDSADDDDDSGDDDDDDDDDDIDGSFIGFVRNFMNQQPEWNRNVELVEDYSSATFSPAVVGVSDRNGLVNLEIPDGFSTAGVRVDLTEDEENMGPYVYRPTYNHGYTGGMVNATILSPPPVGMYAYGLGNPVSPYRTQVIIIVAWGNLIEYEPVGCALVSFSGILGTQASVHYGLFGQRSDTDPDDGIVLGLNFTSGSAHYVQANVNENYEQSEQHLLMVGSTHIIFVFYDRDTYPQNPTPSWCQ